MSSIPASVMRLTMTGGGGAPASLSMFVKPGNWRGADVRNVLLGRLRSDSETIILGTDEAFELVLESRLEAVRSIIKTLKQRAIGMVSCPK